MLRRRPARLASERSDADPAAESEIAALPARTPITEYTWDHRNCLTNVTDRATHGGATTQVVEYGYDAFNRLVHKQIDVDGDAA